MSSSSLPADLSTLESRLTATRAAYIDNLSAGAAALQSTVSSIPTSNKPTVDRGVVSMISYHSGTATIGAVVMANSEARYLGGTVSINNSVYAAMKVVLTNTTTVTVDRITDGGSTAYVSWEVSEY